MIKSVNVGVFLESSLPIVDVRSPGEYEESHIPGSINIPLLNNEHRAKVGSLYKLSGKEAAIQLGFELVNPLREMILDQLKTKIGQNELALYCARGGLRSAQMAKFFTENGCRVHVLQGGYKSYRNFILNQIASFKNLILISAYTGSGKTDVLKALSTLETQVLDLEELANHKGSAFGALGKGLQPTSSQFHNMIYEVLRDFDINQPIWLENESVKIGKVHLPKPLWENMKRAGGVEIQIPLEARLKYTLSQYGNFGEEELCECVMNLKRRLGDEESRRLCELIREKELEPVVRSLFRYYDKSYEFGREKRNCQNFVKISFDELDPSKIAGFLLSSQRDYIPQFD